MKKWIALAMLMVVALVGVSSTNLVQADDDDKKQKNGELDVLQMDSFCRSQSNFNQINLIFRFSSFTVGSQATSILNLSESGGPFDIRTCLDTVIPALESIAQAGGCVATLKDAFEDSYRTQGTVLMTCIGTKSELVQTIADLAQFASTVQFP